MREQLFILGDHAVSERLNVRRESRLLRKDPLESLLGMIADDEALYLHRDVGRYVQARDFYYLSAERCLRNISVGTRYHRQVRPYLGGRRTLSPQQRRLSIQFHDRVPFFRVDLVNLIIHGKIILDRSIAFSRRFLKGPKLPSFTSFSEHRKFLKRHPTALGQCHSEYTDHVVNHTSWFDMPLKAVRDKVVIHSGPPHFQFITYPSEHDMGLTLSLDQRQLRPDRPDTSSIRLCAVIRVSARRLLSNVEEFLKWYGSYATEALRVWNGRIKGGR